VSLAFVCAVCDQPAGEINMRFCKPCGRSYIAGYSCECGHADIDEPGEEMGHEPHAATGEPS
jgi:hypothetical protein